ncbi:MAG: hypothetical protein NXI22_02065 [bacterium]|nr:hypothetical protein [bacterium]
MSYRITSIKPFLPARVGEKSYEFRVDITSGDGESTVLVSAGDLIDYRRFQQAALQQLGLLVAFDFEQPADEVELHWSWQRTLQAADWTHEDDTQLRTPAGEPVIEASDDDDDEELHFVQ